VPITVSTNSVQPSKAEASEEIVRNYAPVILDKKKDTNENIEKIVRIYFEDIPIMIDIADCESRFRQFTKSGNVLRGDENPSDIGVMQINEKFHLDTSKEFGISIYTLEGNLAYARKLYEKEGTRPWKPSFACWKGAVESNTKELAMR
jgi:hypothetical protein